MHAWTAYIVSYFSLAASYVAYISSSGEVCVDLNWLSYRNCHRREDDTVGIYVNRDHFSTADV